MAATFGTAYRNYTSSDTTSQMVQLGTSNPYPQPLWDPPEGYAFLEWNTARDGTGQSRQAGQTFDGIETFYAIWYIPPKYYSVKTSDLVALANIINSRNGATAQLEWPQGYIDAIGIIGTFTFTIAGTTYRAKDNMTWAEWIASDYNTANFGNSYSDYVTFAGASGYNGECVCNSNYTARIQLNQTIEENGIYYRTGITGPV